MIPVLAALSLMTLVNVQGDLVDTVKKAGSTHGTKFATTCVVTVCVDLFLPGAACQWHSPCGVGKLRCEQLIPCENPLPPHSGFPGFPDSSQVIVNPVPDQVTINPFSMVMNQSESQATIDYSSILAMNQGGSGAMANSSSEPATNAGGSGR